MVNDAKQSISANILSNLRSDYEAYGSAGSLAHRAVSTNGVWKAAEGMLHVEKAKGTSFEFSLDVNSQDVTNQKKSGRCWMFAALNILRQHLQKAHKLPSEFELSESYLFFFDKLEKSNYFYQNMIELADRPFSDPLLRHRLAQPQQDGGDWCLMTALIDKYGVVPKDQMGESSCTEDSSQLDSVLNRKLRKDAAHLRSCVAQGYDEESLEKERIKLLKEVYRLLAIALGEPPTEIEWEYRDTDKEFHQVPCMTPVDFYKKFIGLDLNNFVVLEDIPSAPYGKLYGIEMSGNMVGGRPNRYLNIPSSQMRDIVISQLKDGYGVWFASDVMKQCDRQAGILNMKLYDFSTLFGVNLDMDKKMMFDYCESLPTHGMVISGVDIRDGKPTRWKIENSWGTEIGENGYYVMGDNWFDDYVYGIAIDKKYLTDEQRAVFETEPEILPFWNTVNPILSKPSL